MLTLLECMKNNLPSNDSSKFKTTESHMDWEKVAFKDFSGDMCKLKWVEISNEVRGPLLLSWEDCRLQERLQVAAGCKQEGRKEGRRLCAVTWATACSPGVEPSILPLCLVAWDAHGFGNSVA